MRTLKELIESIEPDVLVKGGDWSADQVVGRDFVELEAVSWSD